MKVFIQSPLVSTLPLCCVCTAPISDLQGDLTLDQFGDVLEDFLQKNVCSIDGFHSFAFAARSRLKTPQPKITLDTETETVGIAAELEAKDVQMRHAHLRPDPEEQLGPYAFAREMRAERPIIPERFITGEYVRR